ncbi:hypothetical protein [Listeria rocourtiae]|uniref:hypothetical protein n=1 Tax=Listeria rocourtiae TaxID=647910 RepID=UPI003D2F563F
MKSLEEINAEHEVDKLDAFLELTPYQQLTLVAWCDDNLQKIKSINRKHTSYGLKHRFEYSSGGFYVTNGAFKKAMLEAGFDYIPGRSASKNWCFNVSEKSIKLLMKKEHH